MKFQIEKTSFVRYFQGVMKKIFKFFLTVNQTLTKKLEKNWKKIWSVQKMVVSLHQKLKRKRNQKNKVI